MSLCEGTTASRVIRTLADLEHRGAVAACC